MEAQIKAFLRTLFNMNRFYHKRVKKFKKGSFPCSICVLVQMAAGTIFSKNEVKSTGCRFASFRCCLAGGFGGQGGF